MSVQFSKTAVWSAQMVQATAQQTKVEAEVLLPGGLRDEVRVLHVDASAMPDSCESSGGRVMVGGKVNFRVLYAQGDLTRVKVAEASQDFSRALNAAQGQEHCQFVPACELSGTSFRVFNGRLLLQADLNIYAQALHTQEVNVVTVVNEDDAQVLDKEVAIKQVVGDGSVQGMVRGEFDLSEALSPLEALWAQAEARVEDILGGADGRATVTGTIDLSACYASALPGRPLVYSQHSFPFEQTVTLSGEMGDMLSATAVVTDTAVALEGDENIRRLRAEVGLRVDLQSIREQNVRLVTDVFATGKNDLVYEGETVSFCTDMINEQTAESARVQLLLPENAPRIKTVLCAFAQPVLAGAKEQAGRLNVDLSLISTLLYMTEDSGIPLSYTTETPLRLSFPCSARTEDMLSLSASRVEASMVAGDRAEVRCVMTLHASGARYEQAFVINQLERSDMTVPSGALALYITQPQERLWDVMKRYRLAEGAIKALNTHVAAYPADEPLPLSTRLITYKR